MPVPPIPLRALLAEIPNAVLHGDPDVSIARVTRDSRESGVDVLFVAIAGANVDGHTFVPHVRAGAVVVERDVEPPPGIPVIRVPDSKRALAQFAAALYRHPGRQVPVVGVTGTNGKTTVTTLIEGAARACDRKVGRIGTTGVSIAGVSVADAAFTTPEAPELQRWLSIMVAEHCDLVAMEVSSIGLAQHRVDGIPFAVALFTNLTQDHLDFHGTMEAYRDAKARLFRELLAAGGRAILCADDPAHDALGAPSDAWTYGFAAGATFRVGDVALTGAGSDITLHDPEGTLALTTPLVGRYNACNVAAAYAVLRACGVPRSQVAAAFAPIAGPPGRLERVVDPAQGRLVLVDYAHSEDALANVLAAVRVIIGGQLFVVFGCGGDRDRGKRPKMGEVAARLADVVVVTTDNPRSEDPAGIAGEILAGIPAGRPNVHVELDREQAIGWALARATRGDAVVLAGKGHETYQEVQGVRRPFDDRQVARRAMEDR